MARVDACLPCGGRFEDRFEVREMMLGTRERFVYGECGDCGSLTLAEPPDDLAPYYPRDYYSLAPPTPSRAPIRALKRLRAGAAARGMGRTAAALGGGVAPRWSRWIEAAGVDRNARVCDIGAGSGATLLELAEAGFTSLTGADPFLEEAIETDRYRVERATAAELEGSYELVMFNHSLEHVPDPAATLQDARRLLADGGTVMVRVPVAGCQAWLEYGTDWVAIDAPRHLFVPTLAGLNAVAGQAGLEIFEVFFDSTEMQFWRSEQYRRDVPLFDPASHELDPGGSPFSREQLRAWKRRAEELNARGEGDTAAIFMRAA